MSDDLKFEVENLTLKDKVELREHLSDMINSSRRGGQSPLRCSILLGEMQTAMGWQQPIPYESRESPHVWARTMVAYQMCKEGYTTVEIGRQMMKDHSTVTHMKVMMQDALSLPKAYGKIIAIWNEFQRRIQDDIH